MQSYRRFRPDGARYRVKPAALPLYFQQRYLDSRQPTHRPRILFLPTSEVDSHIVLQNPELDAQTWTPPLHQMALVLREPSHHLARNRALAHVHLSKPSNKVSPLLFPQSKMLLTSGFPHMGGTAKCLERIYESSCIQP